MIRFARDFRLIPIVLLATICLFALKVSGIVFDGGYTLGERLTQKLTDHAQGRDRSPELRIVNGESVPAKPLIIVAGGQDSTQRSSRQSWAEVTASFKGSPVEEDITGSIGGKPSDTVAPDGKSSGMPDDITSASGHGGEEKPAADAGPPLKTSEKPPAPAKLDVGGDTFPLEPGKINSPGERAILGRLQGRRQELDTRQRELDMRESLIKAAEKRLEAKVQELKDIEARIKVATGARDKAEADRFKGIVAMYENMKPKDAARIFNKLDMRVLIEVATALKARTMSEIMANMTSEAAEKLTIEMANRASAQAVPQDGGQLPKIVGKPDNG